MRDDIKHFRYWCCKVLPLVYDDSLSYYEVLCKVVDYLNHVITDVNQVNTDLEGLRADLAIVQAWVNNFDTTTLERLIADHIATMIFVEISDDGYFNYYIPDSWQDIEFSTTGLDVFLDMQQEYGHLVLSY